jgi:hypothetical protein
MKAALPNTPFYTQNLGRFKEYRIFKKVRTSQTLELYGSILVRTRNLKIHTVIGSSGI